jgi:hypothetical protein
MVTYLAQRVYSPLPLLVLVRVKECDSVLVVNVELKKSQNEVIGLESGTLLKKPLAPQTDISGEVVTTVVVNVSGRVLKHSGILEVVVLL